MKRELKWKSDAEAAAAAAAASSSTVISDTTEHQQNVVRSCISRLRRGSDFKTKLASRLPTRDSVRDKPTAVEEEQEQVLDEAGGDVTTKAVVTTTASQGEESSSMTSSRSVSASDVGGHEIQIGRRRQQVLAMLKTAEGQRMVEQMFIVRDELKRELAGLAQRLKRIDQHIETMLQAAVQPK